MYKDYFIHKIINKIMCDGKKEQSFFIFRTSLFYLKVFLGYQPFFLFKHVAFRMRQLFTIQTKLIRKTKLYSMPLLLTPKNQITYGINHLLKCSRLLSLDEKITFSQSLYLVLLNCFIRNIKHKKFPK